jgi:hypothetical protein
MYVSNNSYPEGWWCEDNNVVFRSVCRQRLGEHVPTAMDTRATMQVLWKYSVFLRWPCRGITSTGQGQSLGSWQLAVVRCHLKISLWPEDKEVGVRWPPASELVKELQFSHCELLLLEDGSWGTGKVREPRVRRCPPLKAVTRQRLVDTNILRTLVCAWQWSVKCSYELCV